MDFIWESITDWLKEILISGIVSNLSGMFDSTNEQVGNIIGQVGMTPQSWNSGIFTMIQNLSNTVILPIAGAILAIVMTLELIQLVTDRNNLNDVDTWMFFKWVFKSACAVVIVTHTWDIVMGIFEASQSVVSSAAGVIVGQTNIDISSVVGGLESRLNEMELGPLFGLWFQSLFVGLCTWAITICIFIITYGRMIEVFLAYIRTCFEKMEPLERTLHNKAMLLFKQYMLVGGMPMSIVAFLEGRKDFGKADLEKRDILALYRNDIMKIQAQYRSKVLAIFDQIPGLLSRHEKRVVFNRIAAGSSADQYEETFFWLTDSMVANECRRASDPNVGLSLTESDTYIKCYLGDTGLLVSHAFDENELLEDEVYKQILDGKHLLIQGRVAFFVRHYRTSSWCFFGFGFLLCGGADFNLLKIEGRLDLAMTSSD